MWMTDFADAAWVRLLYILYWDELLARAYRIIVLNYFYFTGAISNAVLTADIMKYDHQLSY